MGSAQGSGWIGKEPWAHLRPGVSLNCPQVPLWYPVCHSSHSSCPLLENQGITCLNSPPPTPLHLECNPDPQAQFWFFPVWPGLPTTTAHPSSTGASLLPLSEPLLSSLAHAICSESPGQGYSFCRTTLAMLKLGCFYIYFQLASAWEEQGSQLTSLNPWVPWQYLVCTGSQNIFIRWTNKSG